MDRCVLGSVWAMASRCFGADEDYLFVFDGPSRPLQRLDDPQENASPKYLRQTPFMNSP